MSNEPLTENAASTPRVSFERLRERTDELELIISGLTTVTLFSLPGWLLDHIAPAYSKLPLPLYIAVENGLIWIMGLCMLLASLFALHLGIRAFWVGLIGLKSTFPQGIQWDKARSYGPITRADLRQRLPDIDTAIKNADRAASILFAVISLGALTALWLTLVVVGLLGSVVSIGLSLGWPLQSINLILLSLVILISGSSVLVWLLDGNLARRWPNFARSRTFRGAVLSLRRVVKITFPERLLAPVQLTLQTNTHSRLFLLAFVGAMILVPFLGLYQRNSYFFFDTFGTHAYLSDTELSASPSLNSRYYESSLRPRDLRRLGPIIPSQTISTTWLPLFLPYWPLLDESPLRALCGAPRDGTAAACLRKLWKVELNGQPVSLDEFFIAERGDLGFRGLQGYVPLESAKPGPQRLEIIWNPQGSVERGPDSVFPSRIEHHIPFLLAPEWGNGAPR